MALRKVLKLRIVSARPLRVEKAVLSSLDQYGYCWRIQEELLKFPKTQTSEELRRRADLRGLTRSGCSLTGSRYVNCENRRKRVNR
jgi:hypothetical protein